MATAHHSVSNHAGLTSPPQALARLLPGVLLSAGIGAVAYGLQLIETSLFGHPLMPEMQIGRVPDLSHRCFSSVPTRCG